MIKDKKSINFIITIYFITILISSITQSEVWIWIWIGVRITIGLIGYILIMSTNGLHYNKVMNKYMVFMLISGILSEAINGNVKFRLVIMSVVAFGGIAAILLNYSLNIKFMRITFALLTLFYIVRIKQGFSAAELFVSSSRNFVSINLLFFVSLLFISYDDNNEKVSLLPLLICFLLSIWAVGRGGIITMGILTLGICGLKMLDAKNKKQMLYGALITLAVLGATIYLINNNQLIDKMFSHFYENGMSDDYGRSIIWSEYIREVFKSFSNLIFGVKFSDFNISFILEGNLHNSFLLTHAVYGFPFLIFNIYLLIKSLRFYIKNGRYEMSILMIAFIVRASTDWVFCNSYGDIFLFYFALYPYSRKAKIITEKFRIKADEKTLKI